MKKKEKKVTAEKSEVEEESKELKALKCQIQELGYLVEDQKKALKSVETMRVTIEKAFSNNSARMEALEDSFLHIMHNIKKNQFLYAHYPEDWVKDYLSIKKGIKYENLFMDKKIQEQEVAQ